MIRAVALCALARVSGAALLGCGGDVVVDEATGTTAASGAGGAAASGTTAASGIGGTGGTVPGTTGAGGGIGTGGSQVSSAPAACSEPVTATIPYSDPVDLYALLIGRWLRCEGVLTPAGGGPAPDGQDGLAFLSPGAEPAEVFGILPDGDALPDGGTEVPPWVGEEYEPVEWRYTDTSSGPGVILMGTTFIPVTEMPVFTNTGNRMVLSDTMWGGTYVRDLPP